MSGSALTRRRLIGGALALGGGGAVVGVLGGISGDQLHPPSAAAHVATVPSVRPGDRRYGDLVRGVNQRFVGSPDVVYQAHSTDHVVRAVRAAISAGQRIAVRSGGHCYEGFVTNAQVRAVIDLSAMRQVSYDPRRRAFAVDAGAALGDAYQGLYKGWGVTIPGGSCPSVGVGGHVAGGGYGPLSRLFGLTVDHLYAVEVVVVDHREGVRTVVATRDSDGPLRDLWWAHTGGGGGNFGIVTRYWFRSPEATSSDPTQLLPAPPGELLLSELMFGWDTMTEAGFTRLLANYGAWHERNSAPDSPSRALFSQLKPQCRAAGSFRLSIQVDATRSDAEQLLADFLAEMRAGTGLDPLVLEHRRVPWLRATEWGGFTGPRDPTISFKIKSAYLRRGFTSGQIAAIYRHLTRSDYQNPGSLLIITAYGGRINAVDPSATAVPHRDAVLKPQFIASWTDPNDSARHLAWVRELYQELFAATGGVPVINDRTDGCYVNYADVDLADPSLNSSGVPWQTLYYKDNYPRLRRAKARWDPLNTFRHAQSVEPA